MPIKGEILPIICLIICIWNQSVSAASFDTTSASQGNYRFHLLKSAWHVGILLTVDSLSESNLIALDDFTNYNFVDIGWGDQEFYQDPDDDIVKALKAAILPTSSVVRVTGHLSTLRRIINWSDFAVEINISRDKYLKLLRFINDSFNYENRIPVVTKSLAEGAIKFYESHLTYTIFYTCNTWVAEALESAGLQIDHETIITANDLFKEVLKFGLPAK
ncbi:MAG: DUF2459 domain-containing protein [Melioribacteraceae bacterium]|nr:DUF2459 domain-containing protein [Melioribacteraceae bacterium]